MTKEKERKDLASQSNLKTFSFYYSPERIQEPRLKFIMDHLVDLVPELADYQGNTNNFGEMIRHIKKKDIDISEIQPLLDKPEAFKGYHYQSKMELFHGPSSQNGNKQ